MTANNTYRLGLQLRRSLSLSSTILSQPRLTATTLRQTTLPNQQPSQPTTTTIFSSSSPRNFHSSPHLSLPSRSFSDVDNIDPETVLFEGCDYKHWLIVIDFGKDPNQRPPPDQMVDFYVQTCAKVLGSVEEAKRRIYACSTTTYTGFQVEVDEDTSKKFETLPGVIFVLPDSYINPVSKEYGGDKYINGDIIPRPPPVQYGRTGRTFQRPRVMPQQGNPPYNQHNSMPHETRSYTPQVPQQGFQHQQNSPPQQNYGPSGPTNRVGYQGGQRNFVSPQQGSYSQDYSHPQGQMNNHPGNHGGYAPSGQYRNDSADYGNYHPQRQRGNVPEGHGGYAPPGQLGLSGGNRSNSPHSITGGYEQTGHGSYEQSGNGQYGLGPNGSYGHGPRYAPHGESQRLPRTSNEQNNSMEHRNYPPGAQTGI